MFTDELRDTRLLTLEIDAIHGLVPGAGEGDGGLPRVRDGAVRAVWAGSSRASVLALGAGVPAPPRSEGSGEAEAEAPGEPPAVLLRLAAELGGARPATVEGGPSFVFPERLAPRATAPLPLLVSDAEGRRAAGRLRRPGNWEPDEWAELVRGGLGSWTMAVHGEEPVSICHTPASNAASAEAGIWTRADFRGRGLAPAAVAAWAALERPAREVLFYSTSAGNAASRSVARTLGLTPLGWIWRLR
ncbi:GNAT family N-acetyltransferase [Streptomyces sp. NPDC048172]|uniref:GNAT family N-acetyltransferase n=1 Tax=Streptomyces sp. NPDC048172 TaxID=3365505 RepID=UPI00371F05F7